MKTEVDVEVSVIMPVFNAEKYLVKAIESVIRQKVSWELLVINDCSTDHSQQILEGYREDKRIRIVRNQKNLGAAESRNIGIRMARGKYVAFLDADDWWESDKLERQCQLMKEQRAVLCYTGRELMREDGHSLGKIIHVPEKITHAMLLRTNDIPCSSVVMRAEVAAEFLMEHAELHEDYILWLRTLEKYGEACGLNLPMLKSRMSEGGKSRNKWKSACMQWGVYRLMGIGRMCSAWYMLHYTIHGMQKYLRGNRKQFSKRGKKTK